MSLSTEIIQILVFDMEVWILPNDPDLCYNKNGEYSKYHFFECRSQ